MPDSQFDDFVGRSLSDLSVPVPEGAWERLADKQFDLHCKQTLQHMQSNVSDDLWKRITDSHFDQHIAEQLGNYIAPVPAGSFEQLDDTRLDHFFGNSLVDYEVPVGEEQWDAIADGLLHQHTGNVFDNYEAPVSEGLWNKIADQQFNQHFADKLGNLAVPVSGELWDSITDGQMDAHFQSQLTTIEAPVPEDMWERVKPREKEDRKFFFWMRFPMAAAILGAILLGGICATYFLYNNYNKENKGSNQQEVVRDAAKQGNFNPAQPNNAVENKENISSESNGSEPITPNTQLNRGNSVIPPDIDPAAAESFKKNGSINNGLIEKKRRNSKTPIHSGFQITQNFPNKNLLTSNRDQDEINAASILPVQGSYQAGNTIQNKKFAYPQSIIAKERNEKFTQQEVTTINGHPIQLPKINCPTVRGRNKWDDFNKDWYVDTYVSPDYSIQTINNLSASQQLLKQKDSSEQMQLGYTAGVRLVKPLNNHFLLTTGLQYAQINQKYVYRSENEIKLTTVVTIRTIIRAPGDTVVVRDTSTVQTVGYKNNVEKNRYRSIDIPILLGYQFGRGSLKVGIHAGAIINVSSWYEGVILDSSMAVVPVQKGSQLYKSKVGLGLYAGVNVTKELSKDMSLFVEPYYKHSLDNITSEKMPYQQKFGTVGVLMGVRWSLNRK